MLKKILNGLLIIGITATSKSFSYTDHAIFRENFEYRPVNKQWFNDDLIFRSYTSNGIDGVILMAVYQPTSKGSERLQNRFALLEPTESATLSFDLKLHSQFEFVKGGKMHGLAGGNGTTGCKPIDPKGWSVRMMWSSDGAPFLYIYHQDRVSNCGDSYRSPWDVKFKRGSWYRVDIYVDMNSSPSSADGTAQLYIDGQLVVDVRNLNLSGDPSVIIDEFLFSTFYGGSNDTWSPSTKTYVYYDNFTVNKGKRISGSLGTDCEIFEQGIFNTTTATCCANSCGSCGGTGCGSLPGGAKACCNTQILNEGSWCLQNDTSAPCYFVK